MVDDDGFWDIEGEKEKGNNRGPRGLVLAREFRSFLWGKKVWWLAPILVMLVLVAVVILFSQASAMSAFVYALF